MTAVIECTADIDAMQGKPVKLVQVMGIYSPKELKRIPDDCVIELCAINVEQNLLWANILKDRQNVICSVAPTNYVDKFPKSVHFDVIYGPSDISPKRCNLFELWCAYTPGEFVQQETVKELMFIRDCAGNCRAPAHLSCFKSIKKLTFRNICCNSVSSAEFDRLGVEEVVITTSKGTVCIDNILSSTTIKSLDLKISEKAKCTYSSDIDNKTITEIKLYGFQDTVLTDMCNRNQDKQVDHE